MVTLRLIGTFVVLLSLFGGGLVFSAREAAAKNWRPLGAIVLWIALLAGAIQFVPKLLSAKSSLAFYGAGAWIMVILVLGIANIVNVLRHGELRKALEERLKGK
jgi:hypothetical protein